MGTVPGGLVEGVNPLFKVQLAVGGVVDNEAPGPNGGDVFGLRCS